MMTTQNFISLFTCSSLLILSLHLFQTCYANCSPSACGIIHNISSPFRLKGDSKHCGDRKYELVCEDNIASIHFSSHKYVVKAINYSDFTIRLVDVFFTNNNECSFPSTYEDTFFHPYSMEDTNMPINLLKCEHPLHNSSLFAQVPDCQQGSGSGRHTYIKVGDLRLTDMDYMCTLDSIVASSWNFKNLKNVSLSEIHESLLYGFDLSWIGFICRKCNIGSGCYVSDGIVTCGEHHSGLYYDWKQVMYSFQPPEGPTAGCLMIFMLVVAVVFAGVSIPAKIIIGFGVCYWVLVKNWWRRDIERIIVVSFEVRFAIGILCGMGFLIYKFRRRRLSVYEEIEDFLQSDNKLSPIRYSYSDLKKMTRGFREKLGQGGFGSVYKGKLRSGHYVAVKLLGKATVNGQDFINEIGTIGRIHHVNVVKLLGYCAERSKRALIFDFMPNGSLDKYILNREKACSLDWDVKFKIAIEVARGIEYLHSGCDIQILHFDIKPHNILLDDKFVKKYLILGWQNYAP